MKKTLIGNFIASTTYAGQTENTGVTQRSFAGASSHGGGSGGISATIPDGNG